MLIKGDSMSIISNQDLVQIITHIYEDFAKTRIENWRESQSLALSGGSWKSEEDSEWEDELQTEIYYQDHPNLTRDINFHKKLFGDNSVSTRALPTLELVEVELILNPVTIVSSSICEAWGVSFKKPIFVKATCSSKFYTENLSPPKIEVYQSREKEEIFGLQYQLQSILNNFVRTNWERFSKSNNLRTSQPSIKSEDEKLSKLVEMGFSLELSKASLSFSGNDLEKATDLLISNPDLKIELESSDNLVSTFKENHKKDDLKKNEGVSFDYGFLVCLSQYVRHRIPTLNDYCVICDQVHVFGNMLKPAVCSRDLCCFSFQQLGVAEGAANEIATAAEVVDLLVCFATIAAKSGRRETIFDPFPTIFDKQDKKKTVLSPHSKDFNLINDILGRFPSIEVMCESKDFSDLKNQMDSAHKYGFDVLQWIITSNRSHIVKLKKDKHINSMCTPHQYLLLSAPPEKEAKFAELKKKHGSIFAFHGSPSENWHSILRTGLKNASGTTLQINGAAYGSGIYLSPSASTSFGYCRMYGTTIQGSTSMASNRFLNSSSIYCIAICEVINSPSLKKNGSIWVEPNPEHVCTRFFFVYTDSNPRSATNATTESSSLKTEIENAMKQ